MGDYGRRIVIDLPFEAALGETARALHAEGLDVIARIDVRDHFQRRVAHDFRRYCLLDAWSPQSAVEALSHNLDAGTMLPTRLAIYELADGETAVVATEPLSPVIADVEWRREFPELATLAVAQSDRVAHVLGRLQHASRDRAPSSNAA